MSNNDDIFNSMLQEFGPPKDLNVIIKTYYQGKQVDKEFFDKNPDLLLLYPSREQVMNTYSQVKAQNLNKMTTIKVSETNGIEIV